MTRLQEIAKEYWAVDEALRLALLRAEEGERIVQSIARQALRPKFRRAAPLPPKATK